MKITNGELYIPNSTRESKKLERERERKEEERKKQLKDETYSIREVLCLHAKEMSALIFFIRKRSKDFDSRCGFIFSHIQIKRIIMLCFFGGYYKFIGNFYNSRNKIAVLFISLSSPLEPREYHFSESVCRARVCLRECMCIRMRHISVSEPIQL